MANGMEASHRKTKTEDISTMRSRISSSGYIYKGTATGCEIGITTPVPIAASPTIAKIQKQGICPSVDE